jgi:hypothetical protein
MSISVVQIFLLGKLREIQVVNDSPTQSQWSGKQLRRINLQLRVANQDEHDALQQELAQTSDGPAVVDDSDGIQWEVSSHDYSYSTDRPPLHQIGLIEKERLVLDRVEFDGLSLGPEDWSLTEDNQPFLSFLAKMDSSEHQKFEGILQRRRGVDGDAGVYFPVLLAGIANQPIRMRFGRCLWQDLGEGAAMHDIVLVPEGDEAPPKGYSGLEPLFQPGVDRLKEGAIRSRRKLDALIAELRHVGVLDDAAVSRIAGAADGKLTFSEVREYDRALDLEDFPR